MAKKIEVFRDMERVDDMTAKEFIDLMMPNHGRSSCSDEDPQNCFYSRNGETWHGRCTRCMYLQIIREKEVPTGFNPDECQG